MNTRLREMFRHADSRHLTAQEKAELLDYAEQLPRRMKVGVAVERIEPEVLSAIDEALLGTFGGQQRANPQGWSRLMTTARVLLRQIVMATITDDMAPLESKIMSWHRPCLEAFSLGDDLIAAMTTSLSETLAQRLPAESFELLEPALRRTAALMSGSANPALMAAATPA